MEMTRILALESSCDETAAAIIENGSIIRANLVATQIPLHQKYGGVVPEIASRKHLETINYLIKETMEEAGLEFSDLTHIAVANSPGLVGALLVGVSTAKALAYALDKPLIAVNHIEGHIYANFLGDKKKPEFPLICLIVSGGHTMLVKMVGHGEYEFLGSTRDDAVGEAFDKVARTLGLGYPGGPLIDKLAKEGDSNFIDFPRASLEKGSYDFSYSGLKSAVLNWINRERMQEKEIPLAHVAASFQEAAIGILVEKTIAAAEAQGIKTIITAGGVSANSRLRELLRQEAEERGMEVFFPAMEFCTDNAAMIGGAAHWKAVKGDYASLDLNGIANFNFADYIKKDAKNSEDAKEMSGE